MIAGYAGFRAPSAERWYNRGVGAWRSLVARFHGVEEVARSNRVAPTTSKSRHTADVPIQKSGRIGRSFVGFAKGPDARRADRTCRRTRLTRGGISKRNVWVEVRVGSSWIPKRLIADPPSTAKVTGPLRSTEDRIPYA